MNVDWTCYKKVTHCIFDMDGLLLDSEVAMEEALSKIATDYKKTIPFELRVQLLGKTESDFAETLISALQLPVTTDELKKIYREMLIGTMADTPLMKGAFRLVRHLTTNKVPVAIGTSSPEDLMLKKMSNHSEFLQMFHHVVCGSTDPEVKKGKPAPDIYLVAASRFDEKPNPAQCLVFEDAPNGVKAAISAGMQAVMVPDERVPAELRACATMVLQSLDQFQPQLFGLPPYNCGCQVSTSQGPPKGQDNKGQDRPVKMPNDPNAPNENLL